MSVPRKELYQKHFSSNRFQGASFTTGTKSISGNWDGPLHVPLENVGQRFSTHWARLKNFIFKSHLSLDAPNNPLVFNIHFDRRESSEDTSDAQSEVSSEPLLLELRLVTGPDARILHSRKENMVDLNINTARSYCTVFERWKALWKRIEKTFT